MSEYYLDVKENIMKVMSKAGEPLTETQEGILSGCLAVYMSPELVAKSMLKER